MDMSRAAQEALMPNLNAFKPAAPIKTHAPTKPVEVLPALQQVSRGYVTICSIYPTALHKRVRHNGATNYRIEAAPRGSYATLAVYDTQEVIARIDPTDGTKAYLPMPIPARVVAEDLVHSWADDTLGKRSGYSPGIAIIKGDEPTAEELQSLRDGQTALFQWYVMDANGKHIKGEGKEITDIHRLAAKELLDKGAERLPWFPKVDFALVKDCLACGKQIEARAKVCPDCGTNLVDWYIKYNLDPKDDPAISEFMAKMGKPKAESKVPPVPEPKSTEPKLVSKP